MVTGLARRRPLRLVVLLLGVVLLASGCSTTLGDLPLPGTGVPGETVEIQVELEDALNLAQGATVKVNGVDSGKVQSVEVEDFRARATVLVRDDAQVRRGARVRLRYTTPLGELFVDVTNPRRGPVLRDGAVIAVADTETAPTVEDALAQASLLVNGGGLDQLQTVTEELNAALGGREGTVRRLLDRSATFLTEANATTADVDRALRALADLSRTLRAREDTIDAALRDVAPAARVLRRNTDGLTRLLGEVEEFAGAASDTVRVTRADLLAIVRQLGPVLAELAANETAYGPSLASLVAAGEVTEDVVPGDYGNIRLDLALDRLTLPVTGTPLPQPPALPPLPLPELPGLPLPEIPGLPQVPGLPGLGGSGGGSGGGAPGGDLGDLLGLGGLLGGGAR